MKHSKSTLSDLQVHHIVANCSRPVVEEIISIYSSWEVSSKKIMPVLAAVRSEHSWSKNTSELFAKTWWPLSEHHGAFDESRRICFQQFYSQEFVVILIIVQNFPSTDLVKNKVFKNKDAWLLLYPAPTERLFCLRTNACTER